MRDVQHIYMNVPRWTGRNVEDGTPWMEAATEAESALSQLDSLLGEFGGIGFSSQMGVLNSVTDGINAMRDARKYLHEEIVRLVDKPLEECFTRAVEALAAIDFDKIRVENKAGLVVNNVEMGEKSRASREVNDYSLSDVLKGNVPELSVCTGYNQKINGFREIIEEMGGIILAKLEGSKSDNEKKKDEKGFFEEIEDGLLNFMAYPNCGRCKDPTGNSPPKSMEEILREITEDVLYKASNVSDLVGKQYENENRISVHVAVSQSMQEYQQFKDKVAMRESSNNYMAVNQYGYMGKYQMGRAALNDIGFKNSDGDWTKKANSLGIYSDNDFLLNEDVQEYAFDLLIKRQYDYMQDFDLYQYVGLTMNNVLITESGMIASMHLVGIGNLKISLEHNDLAYLTDGNGVCPLEYMDSFGGFNIYEAVY